MEINGNAEPFQVVEFRLINLYSYRVATGRNFTTWLARPPTI